MQNLLPKLVEILTDASKKDSKTIKTRDAVCFLLRIDDGKEDSEYSRLKSNPMKLSTKSKMELVNPPRKLDPKRLNNDWDLRELNYSPNVRQEVERQFSEYYKEEIDHDNNADISTKIKRMVFHSVFGTIYRAVFKNQNVKNSYKNSSNYVKRPDVIESIRKHFNANNISILTGEPAIGKTQVILEYIQESDYKEVAWFEGASFCEKSIERQIKNGSEIFIPSDVTIEKALCEKSNDSLIIIERAVLQREDYDYIMNRFNGKKIHIIMVARKAPNPFSKNKNFFTKEEFDSLLEIIDSNTLVVALLGKTLNKFFSKSRSAEEEADIKEKLLDSNKWIWKDKSLPNINQKNYIHNSSTNKVVYFIRFIISKLRISDDDKLQYAELALWVRGTIAVNDLNIWCTDKISTTIDKAMELGIAEYMDDTKSVLKIHPFISDVLWSEFIQNPRGWEDKDRQQIQLKPIALLFEKNISKFLEQLKLGKPWESSYTMLYNTAYTLINRLQMEMYSEEERRFDIEDWRKLWEIMGQILIIFIECGNAAMACDIIQELYFYDCPKNSDNLKGKKFDDKNETESARLNFNKISLEWMNGQDPQPLIDQIPKKVSNIPHEYWQEKWIKIIRKILDKIECGIDIKGLDDLAGYVLDDKPANNNIYSQDDSISEVLNCFQVVLGMLITESEDPSNDLRIKYYRGIFYYLHALYKCDSANDFLDHINKAHSYYKQLFSYEDDMNRDFWFIVRFSHIYYECRILIKDLTIHHPSIQEIQSCFGYLCNLFESTEIEYNKSMHSEECLAVYQRANMFIMIIQAYRTGNNEILVNAVKNMRTSFFDQVHINKKMSETIRSVYDNTEKGLKNISQ